MAVIRTGPSRAPSQAATSPAQRGSLTASRRPSARATQPRERAALVLPAAQHPQPAGIDGAKQEATAACCQVRPFQGEESEGTATAEADSDMPRDLVAPHGDRLYGSQILSSGVVRTLPPE